MQPAPAVARSSRQPVRTRRRRRIAVAAIAVVAAAATAGCSLPPPSGTAPLRYRDAVFGNLTIDRGISYGSAPGKDGTPQNLTLDMYRPTGDTQTKRPAIVLVHGGGFVGGNSNNGAMVKMANAFAKSGYVAVSINYRLLGNGGCADETVPSDTCINAVTAAQHDSQAAIRFLRKNATRYGIDPTRVAIGGGSAGAGTALAVAVRSEDVGDSGNPGFSSRAGASISISASLPDLANQYYDPGDTPILMFNGDADPVVDFAKAAHTAGELYKAKVPVIFEQLAGGGHVPFNQYGDTIINQSMYFSWYAMDLYKAAGQPAAVARQGAQDEARITKDNAAMGKAITP